LLLEAAEELIKGALDGELHNQIRDCGDFACLFGMVTIIQIAAESGPAQKNSRELSSCAMLMLALCATVTIDNDAMHFL
jgi:hypothetical protein